MYTRTRAAEGHDPWRGSPAGAPEPELYLGAVLLGAAILLGEGHYASPLIASYLAILCACVALVPLLARAGSFTLPPALAWLLAMAGIGSVSAVVALAEGRAGTQTDLLRDLGILLSYAGFLMVGSYYGRERATATLVWWMLIALGGVASLIHIWLFVGQIASGVSDLYLLRLEAGRGSEVQFCAVAAAHLVTRGRRPGDVWTKVAVALAALCVLSITLALSRVLLLQLLILVMVFAGTRMTDGTGVLRLRPGRAILVATSGVAAMSLALVSLRLVSEAAFTFVYEGFVEKLLNSWNEIASTRLQTLEDIDQNYRAFESERGLEAFSEAGWFAQWFGQGWGTAVQLGLDTASTRSQFVRTEAAFLHNGYINYLVKIGVVGLVCYLAFMLRLAYLAVREPAEDEGWTQAFARRRVLLAVVLSLAAATLPTGGLGFPAGFLSVPLLIGTCLYTPSRRWS